MITSWPHCTVIGCHHTKSHVSDAARSYFHELHPKILDGGKAACTCHEVNPYRTEAFECDEGFDIKAEEAAQAQAIQSILRREGA